MKKYKIVKSHHLTALEKKLISTSIENDLQDVQTKQKRLAIICKDNEGNIKANLYSYEIGIGIGAKKYWKQTEIIFKINNFYDYFQVEFTKLKSRPPLCVNIEKILVSDNLTRDR